MKKEEERKGKSVFTDEEKVKIISLIQELMNADFNGDNQKGIRNKIRKMGFYFTDFYVIRKDEYTVDNFKKLIKSGQIKIVR